MTHPHLPVNKKSLYVQRLTLRHPQEARGQSHGGNPLRARLPDAKNLVYLVYQIFGCDTVSRMLNRGLKGAKAPSQVSKVSRQAITLGNLPKH